jgi:hypothetical protein
MRKDPIVKEVHETRARILARFGGDFHAYVKYIQTLKAEEQARGMEYVPKPLNGRTGPDPTPLEPVRLSSGEVDRGRNQRGTPAWRPPLLILL